MNIGALELQLLMTGLDKVQNDLKAMEGGVGDSMKRIEGYVGIAKNAFNTFLGVSSVDAFAGMIKGSIDATAALKDMAAQTGASEAALGQFRSIGTYTETSIDSITGAMGKLSKNLINNTEDSKGAGIAIKALGLDFETIRAMKPEDQMLAIAGAMNQFEDGTNKSAAAQALWGKEGAALLPFIKDLGDQVGQVSEKLSDNEVALKKNQAAMADAFGDNLTQIRKESDAWKRDLATGMTPALYEASQAFIDVTTAAGGIRGQISALSKDGSITEWTRGAITGVTYLMDAFSGLGAVMKSAGLFIGAAMAQISDHWNTGGENIKSMQAALRDDLDKTWGEQTLGSKLRERTADLKGLSVEVDTNKGKMGDVRAELEKAEAARKKEADAIKAQEKAAREHNAELKKQEDQYNKLSASLAEKLTAMNTELETGVKLTDGQKLEIKFLEDLRTGNVKFTADQTIATLAKIEEIKQTELLIDARKREKKETDDAAKSYADLIEKLQKNTDSTVAQIEKQRESNDTIFLNKEQLALLSVQKDLDTAATWDQKAAWAEQNMLGADLVQQYKDQATNLRTLAGLKEQGIHVQAAKDAAVEWDKTTKSIGDGLSSSLLRAVTDGKDIWLTFRNYMVTVILDGILRNALSSVFQSALSAFDAALGGVISGAMSKLTGSAIGGAAGSASGGVIAGAGGGAAGSVIAGAGGAAGGAAAAGGASVTVGGAMSTGLPVGTELGALGAAGSTVGATGAAAGGGSAAGTAGVGVGGATAGALMFAYIVGNMLDGYNERYTQLDSGIVPFTGSIGAIPTGGNSDNPTYYRPKAGAVVTYDHLMSEHYGDGYSINVDGIFAGNVKSLSDVDALLANPTGNVIPGFDRGGDFAGGLRIVGENGPELEATGPSRIFDAATTASMLRSGGANDAEVVAELRLLRRAVEQNAINTQQTQKTLDRIAPGGDAMSVRVVT